MLFSDLKFILKRVIKEPRRNHLYEVSSFPNRKFLLGWFPNASLFNRIQIIL